MLFYEALVGSPAVKISLSVNAYLLEYLPDSVFVPFSLTLRLLVLRAISV